MGPSTFLPCLALDPGQGLSSAEPDLGQEPSISTWASCLTRDKLPGQC